MNELFRNLTFTIGMVIAVMLAYSGVPFWLICVIWCIFLFLNLENR